LLIPAPYFVARGFSPVVLDALDVGHSPKRRQSVVPVYDDDGILCVGFLARTENPQCPTCKKYHQPETPCGYGQSKWTIMKDFSKGEYLFNYACARASASPFVLLLEGPCDVFRATEAGVAAVAAFGSDLSPVQADKLAALHKNVVIAYDNDEAGRYGSARAADLLRDREVRTRQWSPPEQFHDVGDMTVDDIVAWLNRLREKIAEDDEVFGPSDFSM
jgi:hypothetical protein